MMHMVHSPTNIRFSDIAQMFCYPNCDMPPPIPTWHNSDMTESVFDIDRVRAAMAEQGVTQTRLAQVLGLTSQSAVSNILKGTRAVKADEAARIYALLGIASPLAPPEIVSVPIIGITNAGAWREAITMPIGHMPLPLRVAGKRSFALEVSGDSMDLLIEDGGYVVVDPDRKELTPGSCYLLQNGDHEATVKLYRRDPARFEPCSSNPTHSGFLVADTDFVVLGRIVWKGAPL